jgi:alkanesulfonate monooxygenase SsuD/methylene tetrahydromethanopterin reductase-like flavin-dependent oxidoreductase (luciferase family)
MPRKSGTPYERIFETLTTLAYLSGNTSRIKLGISSLVLPLRNPLIVAKQLINLDVLSGGRAIVCVSSGWCRKEYEFLGSNFHDRGKRLDDSIRLIRSAWEGKSEFRGKFFDQNFTDAVLDPKPIQRSIPIWVGGLSDQAMLRAARLGDAWHPNAHPLDKFKTMVEKFRKLKGAYNKEICARISLNVKLVKTRYVDSGGNTRVVLCSSKSENKKLIEEYCQLGVTRLIVVPASLPFFAGELFERGDRIVENLEKFASQVM